MTPAEPRESERRFLRKLRDASSAAKNSRRSSDGRSFIGGATTSWRRPGPSCWRWAQDWAQRAVDRDEGAPLPPWEPEHDDEPAIDHVSYAFGVALGRFDRNDVLEHGVLFLNALHPDRIAAKCADDPSLAVAHGCFWRLHPAKAYEWELRLQDEIGPDFTLDEDDSDTLRAAFLAEHPEEAEGVRAAETRRLERKRKKQEKAAAEKAERERGPLAHGPLIEASEASNG